MDILFGTQKRVSQKELVSKNKPEITLDQLEKGLIKARAKNKAWEKEFKQTMSFRVKAKKLEKKGNLEGAISKHLQAIEFGENSNLMYLNNYIFDIDRVIILYSKTKQKEKLKEFLQRNIEKYDKYTDTQNWTTRLTKLNLK